MRAKKAKAIRKLLKASQGNRRYFKSPDTGQVVADDIRRFYKNIKRRLTPIHAPLKDILKWITKNQSAVSG